MSSESERIKEVGKYIEATIAEIDDHTENMEKLFKMDRWSTRTAHCMKLSSTRTNVIGTR